MSASDFRARARRSPARMKVLLGATMLLAPVLTSPAAAQEAEEGVVDDNAIIVTAQRRDEALEDVPMSIAVVSQQTLSNAGVTNLRDLASVTSGYSLAAGGSSPQPAIRGVTSLLNGTFENNVGVYVDGLYQPVASALNIDLPNIDSVQILKGPQGTLYGRNSTGGALLLTTASPTDTWRGKGELTYARFDDKRASGFVAGPLSDAIGVSLAGYVRRSDSYVRLASRTTIGKTECCAMPVEQDAFRAKVRLAASENFTATLAYSFTRISDSTTSAYSPIYNVPASINANAGAATRPTRLGVQAYDIGNEVQAKQHEGGLTLELDTGIGKLKSITGLSKVTTLTSFDFDGTYAPTQFFRSVQGERTFQQYVDFTVDSIENLDLIVGANYFDDRLKFEFPSTNYVSAYPAATVAANTGATPGSLADYVPGSESLFDQKKKAWAIYADATFQATDRLSINLGGRYSRETQDILASARSQFAASVRVPTSVSATFSKFTPRASLRYEISPRTNVYLSYTAGFRSGAFNSQLPACVNFTPVPANCYVPAEQESIRAYEAGFKTAGRNYRFELAGFYYDYKDLQVSATRTIVVGNTNTAITEVQNAPKARIYGIEGSFEVEPVENLTIRGSATWLNARYGDNFIFAGNGVGTTPGVNANRDPLLTYVNVAQFQDLSGLQMSRAPNFTANLGADYLVPMGEGGLRFAANVKYTTKYVLSNPSIWCQAAAIDTPLVTQAANACVNVPGDRQRQQRFVEGAHALLNASVTWTDPTDSYYLRLWGTNLTNHRYRLHWSASYAPMAPPAVYGGTIGYKF